MFHRNSALKNVDAGKDQPNLILQQGTMMGGPDFLNASNHPKINYVGIPGILGGPLRKYQGLEWHL